jgi:arabinofuranan 3-O-arabinosyltransferase
LRRAQYLRLGRADARAPIRWQEPAAAVVTLAALALAAYFGVRQVRDAMATPERGLDFGPMRDAANALLHGASVYSNHRFVYPPSAAIASLPLAIGSYAGTLHVWLIVGVIALAGAGVVAALPWRRGLQLALGAIVAAVLMKSDVLSDSLWIANVSLLLAPTAVAVLLLYDAERWRAGTAVLILSLLVKPLLAPLILVPLLRRQWRVVAVSLAAGAVLLGVSIVALPGGGHFFAVLRFLENGGTLTGHAAVHNVSINGVATRLDLGVAGTAARGVVVAAALAGAYVWARLPNRRGGTAALGTMLLAAAILATSFSEDHYLLVLIPCVIAALAATGEPWILLAAFPRSYLGNVGHSDADLQVRYVLAELAALAAAAAALVLSLANTRKTVFARMR